jgi:hypothetical protein
MGENEPLTFERKDNVTGKLKLNGFYIRRDSVNGNVQSSIYVLYQDGKLLYVGTFDENEFDTKYLTDAVILEKVRSTLPSWGLYEISRDTISFEKWHYTGGAPKITYVRRGSILNDSTFIINQVARPDGSERTDVKETYHFNKFHPKPDSTNDFIK